MKMYELMKPWKLENGDLKKRLRNQNDELRRCQTELEKYTDVGKTSQTLIFVILLRCILC